MSPFDAKFINFLRHDLFTYDKLFLWKSKFFIVLTGLKKYKFYGR